jgi:hypothetical protein
MKRILNPVRVEPAFDDREQIRAMFARYAPYRALATYAPGGLEDEKHKKASRPVLPWFRGDWALGGEPLVDGADLILHNKRFIEAARTAFGTSHVHPKFVAVNINGPMPAGATHLDNPTFYGATRADYPLPFLRVMGLSELFEAWRVVQAGAISWFYEGTGGSFDYWPEGLDGPMLSERPPFGNVALISDNDQLYHRIGAIGDPLRNCRECRPQQRSSRMARVTGPFLRTEKSVPLTRALRFGFPYSGRQKFGMKGRDPTI